MTDVLNIPTQFTYLVTKVLTYLSDYTGDQSSVVRGAFDLKLKLIYK